MADYAQGRLRQKRTQLEWALEGNLTDHQRWMLKEGLGHLKSLEDQFGRAEVEILQRMQPYSEQLKHLVTIPGVDRVVAELGPDTSVFPDAAHAASWAGMCPGNHESARLLTPYGDMPPLVRCSAVVLRKKGAGRASALAPDARSSPIRHFIVLEIDRVALELRDIEHHGVDR